MFKGGGALLGGSPTPKSRGKLNKGIPHPQVSAAPELQAEPCSSSI